VSRREGGEREGEEREGEEREGEEREGGEREGREGREREGREREGREREGRERERRDTTGTTTSWKYVRGFEMMQNLSTCQKKEWKKFLVDVSRAAISGSHHIWCTRNWKDTPSVW